MQSLVDRVRSFVISHAAQTLGHAHMPPYSEASPYVEFFHKKLGEGRPVFYSFGQKYRWIITHYMRGVQCSPSPVTMHSLGLWSVSHVSVGGGVPGVDPSPVFGVAIFASSLEPIDPWVVGLGILLDFVLKCEVDPSHIHTLDGGKSVAHLDRGHPNVEVVRSANSFSGWDARTYGFGVPFPQEPSCALGVIHPHHFDRAGNCRCPLCATHHQPLLQEWVRI